MTFSIRQFIASWLIIWTFGISLIAVPKLFGNDYVAQAESFEVSETDETDPDLAVLPLVYTHRSFPMGEIVAQAEPVPVASSSAAPTPVVTPKPDPRVAGVVEKVIPQTSSSSSTPPKTVFKAANVTYPDLLTLREENPAMAQDLISKTQAYMEKYRAFGAGNGGAPLPVNAEVYVDVSLRYNTPLSYMLTVARLESHFGTNCFNGGNLTRICKHRNIFSMGLDDSGNNITYQNWDQGVEAFGIWYRRRIAEGLKNCSIWRRYNPNGDYCGKVNGVARSIESYFNS